VGIEQDRAKMDISSTAYGACGSPAPVVSRSVGKPRVVYWFDIPTPTPMARCNAIADLGSLDFEVWFNRRTHGWDHQVWDVDEAGYRFAYRYVRQNSILGKTIPVPLVEMRESRPDLIVHDYWPWNLALGVLGSKATAGRTALRVLPNYDAWSRRTTFQELAKHFVFRAVDGAKVPGAAGAAMGAKYGLPEGRTSRVAQTIDVEHFATARTLDADENVKRREELGLSGVVFLFIGRIWSGKGLDTLFEAYDRVSRRHRDISLLLLGDGPDEAHYRQLAAGMPNARFAGWISEAELPAYLGISNVMVFPTLGDPHGLVVEEAMAAGIPVISSDRAGEIKTRLPDGKAGYVVPAGDAAALADRMVRLLVDPDLRTRQGLVAREIAAQLDHAHYAEDFVVFVQKMLALPPRGSRAAKEAALAGRVLTRLARPLRGEDKMPATNRSQ
jgi:glycosyltransferase involved in cell wall biosynthesis